MTTWIIFILFITPFIVASIVVIRLRILERSAQAEKQDGIMKTGNNRRDL
jgi:hypothetical protein